VTTYLKPILILKYGPIRETKKLHTREDTTTCYGREQKEKGKLQITEEPNNGLRKTKVGC
jgi:hypothetical protein